MANPRVNSPPTENFELSVPKYSNAQAYPPQNSRLGNTNRSAPPAYHLSQPSAYPHGNPVAPVSVVVAPPVHAIRNRSPPSDHMGWSIFSMFCCLFIGGLALRKSRDSRDQYHLGNYAQAKASGQSALKYAIVAIITGVILVTVIILFRVLNIVSDTDSSSSGSY